MENGRKGNDMKRTLYRKICSRRFFCVPYEMFRWTWHQCTGWWPEKTAPWYRLGSRPFRPGVLSPADSRGYRIRRPLYRHEEVHYNLDYYLDINKIATYVKPNTSEARSWDDVPSDIKTIFDKLGIPESEKKSMYGVGAQFDRNNSPIVGKLLAENPHFDKVSYFNGTRHPLIWKNYDYESVFQQIPPGFLVVPVYYEYSRRVTHRVINLLETFGLDVPAEPPVPVMYFPSEPAAVVSEGLQTVRSKMKGKKGIVFLQLDSRGSNYIYPHVRELAEGLIGQGYTVISVTKGGPTENPNYVELDIKKLTINQTWQWLALLKKEFPLYVIAVNSVFWAASAGLDLPNLGLQHWVDKKVHNLWYPNIEVVTNYYYPFLPREKQVMAPPESYTHFNRKIVNYKPDWVLKWFLEKFGK